MYRRKLLLVALSAVLTVSCDNTSLKPSNDVRQRLVGRWAEEFSTDGNQIRSIVILSQDGKFLELEKVLGANGSTKQETHAGEWSFDGTNFKRKYTSLNGQPLLNAQFGYTTYEVKLVEKNEFVGVDNVRTREVRFRRTDANMP